ncbi:hypothetical protein LQW54_000676 [Pestalotiopsis sp. IQ-011]
MRFAASALSAVLLVLAQIDTVTAACRNPLVRKEWRTLSNSEKQSYLSAVQCLKKAPAQTQATYAGVRNRYDDFMAQHINRTDFIHFVGFFQPWHRMFVAQYESELRSVCGYTGAQPYWNWSLDAWSETAFVNSPVFDPVNGFGGNGPYIDSSNDTSVRLHIPGKTGCVLDGPFKNTSVNMGPGYNTSYNPHCLTRDLAPSLAVQKLNISGVAYTLAARTFAEFDVRVEGGVEVADMTYHGGGHLSVGGDLGEMGNIYSSPGDPLFYLHHANMDRLWYTWQLLDWQKRKSEIAGPDTQFAYPFDFFGEIPYTNITLDYEMDFSPLGPNRKVSEVMDPQAGPLCYLYL